MDRPSCIDTTLALPVAVVDLCIRLPRRLDLPRATVTGRLHGALTTILEEQHVTDLLPHRSDTQRWEFPAPWSLRSIELVPRSAGADLNAELAFFGQSAVETHERAVACLREGDLLVDDEALSLATTLHSVRFTGSLEALAARVTERLGIRDRVVVELREPFDVRGEPFSLPAAVAGVALLLARWSLEPTASTLGDAECKARAEALADHVRDRCARLDAIPRLRDVRLRDRRSVSNGNTFPLRGWVGTVELIGDVAAVMPWLVALGLRGGRHRKFGLSEVGLVGAGPR